MYVLIKEIGVSYTDYVEMTELVKSSLLYQYYEDIKQQNEQAKKNNKNK